MRTRLVPFERLTSKRRGLRAGLVPGARTLAVLALAVSCALALADRVPAQDAKLNPTGYTSARQCGKCHEDIYKTWRRSLHAYSLDDPIFDAAFMQALKAGGEEVRVICLRCHAPTTMVTEDYNLSEGVSREGVTCDFCHSVTGVHLDGRAKPYSSDPGRVKRSVLRNAESPAHEVAYSELHAQAEFCGGCHNYVTGKGAAVLSTYDEWKAGPYSREGITCQDCHMGLRAGNVVKAGVKKGGAVKDGSMIHLHDLIHDSEQLRAALEVKIADVRRTDRGLEVDVTVENVGSGHKVPTGIPSRAINLVVRIEGGGQSLTQERRYQKIVADERGRPLQRDYEVLLYGAKILNDTRIAPREKREERFTFRLLRSREIRVSASLKYRYSAPIIRDEELEIELGKDQRVVR